jgi:hypothetical protein
VLTWTRSAGTAAGGKSRRDPAGACLEAEPRGDVSLQSPLVALDRKQVVAALLDDLRAQVALAKHRIAQDDAALDGQDAQQFQSGLVLVGLGIDPDLGEDGVVLMRVGGHEVVPGRRAVAAAAQGLPVEGDGLLVGTRGGRCRTRGDPARQTGLEGGRVQSAVEIAKARRGGGFAATESQGMSQGNAVVAAELGDRGGSLAAAEHGQHGQAEDGQQRVTPAVAAARVGDVGEGFEQGKGSHRGNLH